VNTFQLYIRYNDETLPRNYCYNGKAVNNTYSGCVLVDLGIQYAVHMNIIVICDLSCCKIFSTLSHKRHDCL